MLKQDIINDLYDFQVQCDITIEELADVIVEEVEKMRKKGHWEHVGEYGYECVACGGYAPPDDFNSVCITLTKFCPHCGAEMDNPNEEEEA